VRGVLVLTIAAGVVAGFGLGLMWFDGSRGRDKATWPTRTVTFVFQANSAATRLLGKGWSAPESWGVWSIDRRAELAIPIREKLEGDVSVSIEAKAFVVPPQLESQGITVEVNGNEVAKLSYGKADTQRAKRLITVPKEAAIRNNPMRIAFNIMAPRSPAELGVSKDARMLGIGLLELTLTFPSSEIYVE